MQPFPRNNGLSITLFALFLIAIMGEALTGGRAHIEDFRLHALPR
jgi:hypothetical protein